MPGPKQAMSIRFSNGREKNCKEVHDEQISPCSPYRWHQEIPSPCSRSHVFQFPCAKGRPEAGCHELAIALLQLPHPDSSGTAKPLQDLTASVLNTGEQAKKIFLVTGPEILFFFPVILLPWISLQVCNTKIKQSVCYPRELQSAFHRQTVPKSCLQLLISKAGGFCTLLAAEPGAIWAWALPRGSTATSASQCSSQMKNFGGCCGNGWKSRRTIAEPKHTNSRPYENFDHVHFWQDIFSGGLTGKKEP